MNNQNIVWSPDNLSCETRKSYKRRVESGFINKYLRGKVIDIGYKGYEEKNIVPVVENAIGFDLDWPGYDGKNMPFEDESFDCVYASHVLEHIEDYSYALREWFRILKTGGYMIIAVPHKYLYEKRDKLPSRWNADHKRFYTPSSLLYEIETSLIPNTYRIRHLIDDDEGYNYEIGPDKHCGGCCQIELVIQKLKKPNWDINNSYQFLYTDGNISVNINTKKIIDKIDLFFSLQDDITKEFKYFDIFIQNLIILLKELNILKNHFTVVNELGVIYNIEQLLLLLFKNSDRFKELSIDFSDLNLKLLKLREKLI